MRFVLDLATSLLLLVALCRESVSTPLESAPRASRDLDSRAMIAYNGGCVKPSQLSLRQAPDLGSCNWKVWTLCTAVAAGACLPSCIAGGYVLSFPSGFSNRLYKAVLRPYRFADPACEACLAGLGVLGCLKCVRGDAAELSTWVVKQMASRRHLEYELMRSVCAAKPNSTSSDQSTSSGVATA